MVKASQVWAHFTKTKCLAYLSPSRPYCSCNYCFASLSDEAKLELAQVPPVQGGDAARAIAQKFGLVVGQCARLLRHLTLCPHAPPEVIAFAEAEVHVSKSEKPRVAVNAVGAHTSDASVTQPVGAKRAAEASADGITAPDAKRRRTSEDFGGLRAAARRGDVWKHFTKTKCLAYLMPARPYCSCNYCFKKLAPQTQLELAQVPPLQGGEAAKAVAVKFGLVVGQRARLLRHLRVCPNVPPEVRAFAFAEIRGVSAAGPAQGGAAGDIGQELHVLEAEDAAAIAALVKRGQVWTHFTKTKCLAYLSPSRPYCICNYCFGALSDQQKAEAVNVPALQGGDAAKQLAQKLGLVVGQRARLLRHLYVCRNVPDDVRAFASSEVRGSCNAVAIGQGATGPGSSPTQAVSGSQTIELCPDPDGVPDLGAGSEEVDTDSRGATNSKAEEPVSAQSPVQLQLQEAARRAEEIGVLPPASMCDEPGETTTLGTQTGALTSAAESNGVGASGIVSSCTTPKLGTSAELAAAPVENGLGSPSIAIDLAGARKCDVEDLTVQSVQHRKSFVGATATAVGMQSVLADATAASLGEGALAFDAKAASKPRDAGSLGGSSHHCAVQSCQVNARVGARLPSQTVAAVISSGAQAQASVAQASVPSGMELKDAVGDEADLVKNGPSAADMVGVEAINACKGRLFVGDMMIPSRTFDDLGTWRMLEPTFDDLLANLSRATALELKLMSQGALDGALVDVRSLISGKFDALLKLIDAGNQRVAREEAGKLRLLVKGATSEMSTASTSLGGADTLERGSLSTVGTS